MDDLIVLDPFTLQLVEQKQGGRVIAEVPKDTNLRPEEALAYLDRLCALWNTSTCNSHYDLVRALEEIMASAHGNGPLSRDRDADTLSMIEKHASRALGAVRSAPPSPSTHKETP